ncbi:hypothetical protein ACP70R_022096 [Stipagrostis hirtigluma subsp. patula]
MEHQKPETKAVETPISRSARLLHASGSDELGQSLRVYCPATGRIPFEWEDEPGKPKGSERMDVVPPLCPSPAMQSARLAQRNSRWRRRSKAGAEAAGFEGCIPLRFHFGRAMKRWV